ncbi:MAG: type I restriction enzyme HsdR N-terminal domain-containing protein [Cyclobacteriaceae bacterium]
MSLLNLPEFEPRIREGEIFCLIRKKWVALLPEEWVRQHFLNLLTQHLNYPKGMIQLEHSMQYFKNQKRSDITILDKEGRVFMLVECKSYKVKLTQKTVNQVSEYSKVLDAAYIAISNGLRHFIWVRREDGFEQEKDFPRYEN